MALRSVLSFLLNRVLNRAANHVFCILLYSLIVECSSVVGKLCWTSRSLKWFFCVVCIVSCGCGCDRKHTHTPVNTSAHFTFLLTCLHLSGRVQQLRLNVHSDRTFSTSGFVYFQIYNCSAQNTLKVSQIAKKNQTRLHQPDNNT